MKLYFDIDTQIDFLFPAGALYVPGAEKLVPAIAKLNREAIDSGAKLISTMCAHAEDDPEFKFWPPHCVVGTIGQTKPCALPTQLIIEKQELDLFSNPKTDEMLREFGLGDCVVYGVVTEYCVQKCAMGLLDRGHKVTLVENAIQHLSTTDATKFLEAYRSRGGAIR